ncbi:hypothetical protein SCHPADRAFT_890811 [Schizopora paradoxa]|uniref:NACHT domain-containing protein n=1 Tax=Schizopora paradoxa TaxID=27342 RepID=A0A0H2RKC4_9AGAM|nr:hypothetical protein SCHPADRAFT_890811 [Schizopora paradoxa]
MLSGYRLMRAHGQRFQRHVAEPTFAFGTSNLREHRYTIFSKEVTSYAIIKATYVILTARPLIWVHYRRNGAIALVVSNIEVHQRSETNVRESLEYDSGIQLSKPNDEDDTSIFQKHHAYLAQTADSLIAAILEDRVSRFQDLSRAGPIKLTDDLMEYLKRASQSFKLEATKGMNRVVRFINAKAIWDEIQKHLDQFQFQATLDSNRILNNVFQLILEKRLGDGIKNGGRNPIFWLNGLASTQKLTVANLLRTGLLIRTSSLARFDRTIFIVLDALDKGAEDADVRLRLLLKYKADRSEGPKLRILITSRPETMKLQATVPNLTHVSTRSTWGARAVGFEDGVILVPDDLDVVQVVQY